MMSNGQKNFDMDVLKRTAAMAAANQVTDGSRVGLGSGTTLAFFIEELGRRVREEGLRITGVPTSLQAHFLARQYGVPLVDAMDVEELDLAVDGADEVDPAGNLIKGAGAAHVVEKIVAAMAKRFIVVVDERKIVPVLGRMFAVPIDVVSEGLSLVIKRLASLGAKTTIRESKGKMGPVISEPGHIVVDAKFDEIRDPAKLDAAINSIPGVAGHGLFIGMANEVIVAYPGDKGAIVKKTEFQKH